VAVADRVGLHEPPHRRRVDTRLVIIHAELAEPHLPGVLEPPAVGRAGDAIFIVAVDGAQRAGVVGPADDAAALVGAEEGAAAGVRAGILNDRLVRAGPEHI